MARESLRSAASSVKLHSTDLNTDELRLLGHGKGPKDRDTLSDPGTAQLLRGRGDGPLFPLSRMTVWNILRDTAKRTGLWQRYEARGQRVSPHTLRHAYATHCYMAGMPLNCLGKLLGHSHEDDTFIYLHPDDAWIEAAYSGPRQTVATESGSSRDGGAGGGDRGGIAQG